MTWQVFGTTPNPTGLELDANLAALARMGAFPCTVGGSANAITLTFTDTNAPPLNVYANYIDFAFIPSATNNSAVTIKVGALATLNAYKDTATGPVALTGAEIVQNTLCLATYDSTLNSNAGGFHVQTIGSVGIPINPSQLQISGGGTVTRFLSGQYTIGYTVMPANTLQEGFASLAGVQVGDAVLLGLPGLGASIANAVVFTGRVTALGTVVVRGANITAASVAAFTISPVHIMTIGAVP